MGTRTIGVMGTNLTSNGLRNKSLDVGTKIYACGNKSMVVGTKTYGCGNRSMVVGTKTYGCDNKST
jgi:hypothetical protein